MERRVERILERELVQAGVRRLPGETVRLRPDQAARLDDRGITRRPAGRGQHREERDGAA